MGKFGAGIKVEIKIKIIQYVHIRKLYKLIILKNLSTVFWTRWYIFEYGQSDV